MAPIRITKTMAVVFAVSVSDPVRLPQVNLLFMMVMENAPKAPTPAASVGVNHPV